MRTNIVIDDKLMRDTDIRRFGRRQTPLNGG